MTARQRERPQAGHGRGRRAVTTLRTGVGRMEAGWEAVRCHLLTSPSVPSDVDECRRVPTPCAPGRCENTPGSFRCVCGPGFRAGPRGTECLGEKSRPHPSQGLAPALPALARFPTPLQPNYCLGLAPGPVSSLQTGSGPTAASFATCPPFPSGRVPAFYCLAFSTALGPGPALPLAPPLSCSRLMPALSKARPLTLNCCNPPPNRDS